MTRISSNDGPRHFLDIDSLSRSELFGILDRAVEYKDQTPVQEPVLDRKTLGMIFQKPSTRTRVSFETGMTQLGGHAVYLNEEDIHLGRGEPLKDTARALSGYVDCIMARVHEHEDIEELAEHSDVPVINGLTDSAHPCQTLADILTIYERSEDLGSISVAWLGDFNNVARSLVIGCALADIDIAVAVPEGSEIDEEVLERAERLGVAPKITDKPVEAVKDTDFIYTDVWVSMGEDKEDKAYEGFKRFQVNEELLQHAPGARVMHCLPAHRGEEITDKVIEGSNSIVWEQAENRLYVQKALLVWLLES